MTTPSSGYTFCSTYDSVASAVAVLSCSPILMLDCEARDIGRSNGVLSLISVADADVRNVYLLDALALSDPRHPAMRGLFQLLSREDVTKVMWDGRSDAVELHATYGVVLRGVLDLQLIEVVSRERFRGETDQDRRRYLMNGYFKHMQDDMLRNPAAYDGIYRIIGMNTCLRLRGIVDRKDPAIVDLHKTAGSSIWLQRPLPAILTHYAAHDISLIWQIYIDFLNAGWINGLDLPLLHQQSARYVRSFTSRRAKDIQDNRFVSLFVPMDVLDEPPVRSSMYTCEGCMMALTLRCFALSRIGGRDERHTFCRLCLMLARRNQEKSQGRWVTL